MIYVIPGMANKDKNEDNKEREREREREHTVRTIEVRTKACSCDYL